MKSPRSGYVDPVVHGLTLCPERAAWWPEEATLFIADLHLGKAAFFRAQGVAIPEGSMADDLQRLGLLVQRLAARRLIVLGDFWHARAGQTDTVRKTFAAWREEHRTLEILLVPGNHDARSEHPPPAWEIALLHLAYPLGPYTLYHEPPAAIAPGTVALCGHVHPVVRLRDPGSEQTLRLPAFVAAPQQLMLPAFSDFTGGARWQPTSDEQAYVTDGGVVHAVPRPQHRS